ncbi:MAG: hypothetical protein JRI55_35610, partial [Deltaproteobacteria bacterium]|nr:hypothetical protein [Deltaproteobacteria bacterium]
MLAGVVLVDAGPAALCDGAALGGYLECPVWACHLDSGADPSRLAAELAGRGTGLVLAVVEEHSLVGVLRVIRLLPPGITRLLVGRALSDPRLQRLVKPGEAEGIVVGEPFLTTRAVVRALVGADTIDGEVPGLLRPGGALTPRGPVGNLDGIPAGRYADLPREVALQVPLRPSRGYPHACLFSAERVWEAPVRRRSITRVLQDLRLHVEQDGATHFRFTDLCLNTSSTWMLELCRGIVDTHLALRWSGRVWADPRLDRAAVRLMRRSGCRA